MYKNSVNLIGFLGNDATIHTGTTAASPPSHSPPKAPTRTRRAASTSRIPSGTNCVVFGKLATFAGSLKKGAHVEIDGELRSREYTSKKTNATTRVWEIKVKSILKLDRAEQAAAEEAEFDETEEFATVDVAA